MGDGKAKDGGMREAMPQVTAFIDSMREAFGAELINGAIRNGLKDGTFWAVEGDQVVGMPFCHYPRLGPCEAPAHVKKTSAGGRK